VKKILFIAGTRPEAIKLAPVYLEMRRRGVFVPILCATGQHTDLFSGALQVFGISPELSLNTMHKGQSLPRLTAELFGQLADMAETEKPQGVIVQGDTMSAFAGAWVAFLLKIPVLHVEAGLRTHNLANPFPEEANRRAITIIASLHAAPTERARETLLKEGVPSANIIVSGNTAIDAVMLVRDNLANISAKDNSGSPRIMVTCHRRENFGPGLEGICTGIRKIAAEFPDVQITWVSHPNPAVGETPRRMLHALPIVQIVSPLGYEEFVREMLRSDFLISDSGGIQEEGPALGKPVLVTREVTERPEASEIGATKLVGTDPDRIAASAGLLLRDDTVYDKMANAGSPYGNGNAAALICDFLAKRLN
jgi:UDP-N-acetylglucosamine 2-epimerase